MMMLMSMSHINLGPELRATEHLVHARFVLNRTRRNGGKMPMP